MRETRSDTTLAVLLAVGLHLLIVAVALLGLLWSSKTPPPSAGEPIQADIVDPNSLSRSARRALANLPDVPDAPEPVPEPVTDATETPPPPPATETAPEETVPPPQPVPEPRPQDAQVAPQQKAQEQIPVPDKIDQEAVTRDKIAAQLAKEKVEQEAKRRQEQVDLTERERQKQVEAQKRLATQQQEEVDRQKKIADIRKQRELATNDAKSAEQKLRALAAARAANASAAQAAPASAAPPPGQGGVDKNLLGAYVAAVGAAVRDKWTRPDSVPLGQPCRVAIRQIRGGRVLSAKADASCPYDEAGKRSIESAVLLASPLPYRGFEAVFQEDAVIVFRPQD